MRHYYKNPRWQLEPQDMDNYVPAMFVNSIIQLHHHCRRRRHNCRADAKNTGLCVKDLVFSHVFLILIAWNVVAFVAVTKLRRGCL